LARGEVTVDAPRDNVYLLACIGIDETYKGPHPISGGSDEAWGVVPGGQGLDGPLSPESVRLTVPFEGRIEK
jgi:hypothetical protein